MENRKQFFSRFEGCLGGPDLQMMELAYILSKASHRHQSRQELDKEGNPLRYFEHPRRTALIAIDELRFLDWELFCILLLHDVVEDTDYITFSHLELWFTPRIAECVKLLSKLPKAGYEDRLLGCAEWRALITKGCDRLDNLRSLGACSKKKRERKLQETVEKYYPIFDRMVSITPLSYQPRAELLVNLIKTEVATLQEITS